MATSFGGVVCCGGFPCRCGRLIIVVQEGPVPQGRWLVVLARFIQGWERLHPGGCRQLLLYILGPIRIIKMYVYVLSIITDKAYNVQSNIILLFPTHDVFINPLTYRYTQLSCSIQLAPILSLQSMGANGAK